MTKPQIGHKTQLRLVNLDSILRTLDLIFLADEDQTDGSGNDDYQSASKQTIEEIG